MHVLQRATDPTNFVSLAGRLDLWPENPISITGNYHQEVQVALRSAYWLARQDTDICVSHV